MAKDELENILDGLGLVYTTSGVTGIFDRAKWIRREDDIEKLVQRIQNHKSLLILVLTVLQCNSTVQIQTSLDHLTRLMGDVTLSNASLVARMNRLEDHRTPGGMERDFDSRYYSDKDDESTKMTTQSNLASGQQSGKGLAVTIPSFDFESELQNSTVYRKHLFRRSGDVHSETSITTRHRRGAAASIFSAISLADISNISLYSLPIFIQEIGNNKWYINHGRLKPLLPSFIDMNEVWILGSGSLRAGIYHFDMTDTPRNAKMSLPVEYRPAILQAYIGHRERIPELDDEEEFGEQLAHNEGRRKITMWCPPQDAGRGVGNGAWFKRIKVETEYPLGYQVVPRGTS